MRSFFIGSISEHLLSFRAKRGTAVATKRLIPTQEESAVRFLLRRNRNIGSNLSFILRSAQDDNLRFDLYRPD